MQRKIFIAFSYQSDFDKDLANNIQELTTNLGFKTETGEFLGGGEIPDMVRTKIKNCDGLVALLTRREQLADGGWTTHDWVKEELNFARAQGKRALAITESDVAVGGMYAYHERVDFDRNEIAHLFLSVLTNLRIWKDNWGKACEVRLQPDEIAGCALKNAANVWFRTYRTEDGYSEWSPIEAIGKPGGVFVYLKGVADGADIQFKIEDGASIYQSKTESQWIKIDLEVQQ